MTSNIGNVPCGTCNGCCRNELIVLHPEDGDIPALYTTIRVRQPLTGLMVDAIPLKDDGACIYLGAEGCTIHARRPAVCRAFDCRVMYHDLARHLTRPERRRVMRDGAPGSEVIKAGYERLATLVATAEEIASCRTYHEIHLAKER